MCILVQIPFDAHASSLELLFGFCTSSNLFAWSYISAAARALVNEPHLDAGEVALRAMNIAADMCVFTNHNFVIETIDAVAKSDEAADEPLK